MNKKQLKEIASMNDTQLYRLLCGKMIGHGCSREVYECKIDSNYVVKRQYVNPPSENIIEFEIWESYKYAGWHSQWLAECLFISKTGRILIQQKVEFKPKKKDYPKQVPYFFTDLTIYNFGFVNGQLKCCDYAASLSRMTGIMTHEMRIARW